MRITEVRIRLAPSSDEKLLAFAVVTFDACFVVRDIRIIQGPKGPFVAMPSRRLSSRCGRCNARSEAPAKYCKECGVALPQRRRPTTVIERRKFHVDIAHPVTKECREMIEAAVITAYREEAAQQSRCMVAGVGAPGAVAVQGAPPPASSASGQAGPDPFDEELEEGS